MNFNEFISLYRIKPYRPGCRHRVDLVTVYPRVYWNAGICEGIDLFSFKKNIEVKTEISMRL